jgi:hypothetical protein
MKTNFVREEYTKFCGEKQKRRGEVWWKLEVETERYKCRKNL